MNRLLFLLIPLLALSFFSCSNNEKEVLRLVSDNPETILLAEFMNSQRQDLLIIPDYRENITPELLEQQNYDCVISGDLASPLYQPLIEENPDFSMDESAIYSRLWLHGGSKSAAIPLAFNLPVVLYREDQFSNSSAPRIILPENLQNWNSSSIPQNGFQHLGFSPLWNSSYLRYRSMLLGEDYQRLGEFDYSITLINDLLTEEAEWINENQGDMGHQFSDKYRYIPDLALLLQGRIDFTIDDLVSYFSIQESQRSQLGLSYLGNAQGVRPLDVQYAAVLKRSSHKEEALALLSQLTDGDFQRDYMEWKRTHRNSSFGYLGGLSSNSAVNRTTMAEYYPDWGRRIILEDQVLPAPFLPVSWKALSNDMLDNWFQLYFEEENPMELMEYYQEWSLHFIP